jgi:diphthamide biosynthesis methyltransferase
MLYLIGLGIWDEKDLSLRGKEACKKAKEIYAELYTARWGGSLKNLEKLVGKKIQLLERKDLEDKSAKLVEKAKSRGPAFRHHPHLPFAGGPREEDSRESHTLLLNPYRSG